MPNRILREGILSSERVDALANWASECFYRRLHSIVDDFGRYYGNPSLIRAAAYPLKLDKVSNADIDKWLADCAGAGLVSTYESDGKRYLQLLDFRQQQRATVSKFPQPPLGSEACARQLSSGCAASAQPPNTKAESKLKSDTKTESKAGIARSRKSPLPEDFSLSDRVNAWAIEQGFDRLDEHLDAFKRKCAANGYVYIDHEAAFMEAVREDWAKLRGGQRGQAPAAVKSLAQLMDERDAKRAAN
jgi:hypothetical protein